jgi:hypothetical protein
VYDEESEDDDGYGNYAMHSQDPEEEKPKGDKSDEVKDLAEGMQNVQFDNYSERWYLPCPESQIYS